MIEALYSGLVEVLRFDNLVLMVIGIFIGFLVGLLPGLGGATAIALMLPFTFQMEPTGAFSFLLGMAAAVGTTGDITSILFGVPGESTSAALVVDGHPMAKEGQAGRALGAALASSLVGAMVGAAVLLVAIPVFRPLVLALGSPEFFMLTLLGVTFLGVLSGRAWLKGLIAGSLGLLLATVGIDPISGVPRYTFGQLELWDGIGLIPVTIGLFAIPELLELAASGSSISRRAAIGVSRAIDGAKDVLRHLWLTVRCGAIGAFVGMLPGLGNSVGQWVSYGHAVQSSSSPERFGKGAVEGVIGPGAANNAGLAGSLIPTVALGVPGGLTAALLLGAFVIQGINPGPEMLTTELTLTLSFVWILILSNIVTVGTSFVLLDPIARVTNVRAGIIVPLLMVLVFVGGFAERNQMFDVGMTILFGALGTVMVKLDWPRAPLILGVVLGGLAERYLFISVQRYDLLWLLRPGVIVILVLIAAAIAHSIRAQRRLRRAVTVIDSDPDPDDAIVDGGAKSDMVFAALIGVAALASIFAAAEWRGAARLFPQPVAVVVATLSLTLVVSRIGTVRFAVVSMRGLMDWVGSSMKSGYSVAWLWLIGFALLIWLLGFPLGSLASVVAYMQLSARERWPFVIGAALIAGLFFALASYGHLIPFRDGIFITWLKGFLT